MDPLSVLTEYVREKVHVFPRDRQPENVVFG
jgi:hypothetical protein